MSTLTASPAWQALERHQKAMVNVHMRDLFAQDPRRFDTFSLRFQDILLDYSKNRITAETMRLLRDLARQADLKGWTEKMFNGEKINLTEQRAVLHIALRNRSNHPLMVDGQDVMPAVHAVLKHMQTFSDAIRSGTSTGYTGERITDVVNIRIGGRRVGPGVVTRDLHTVAQAGVRAHSSRKNVNLRHLREDI